RNVLCALVLVLSLVSCTSVPPGLDDSSILYSTAKISDDYGSGSGVVIKKDGDRVFILTNEHVVTDPNLTYKVQFVQGYKTEIPATVVASDPYYDIALLELTTDIPVLQSKFCSTPAKVLDPVIAVGAGLGLFPYATKGHISNPYVELPDWPWPNIHSKFLQHTAPIMPGHSGGPLYRKEGGKYCLEG